jgi:hypothetical protein
VSPRSRSDIDQNTTPYRQMVEHFQKNIALAEPSTRGHFRALIHFVALWDQYLANAVPRDVLMKLQDDGVGQEERVGPLYKDLAEYLERLAQALQE